MQPDSTFLAWLAGFVDGEGCITLNRRLNAAGNPSYSAVLMIANTDRTILEHIGGTLGVGGVYAKGGDRHFPNTRPAWQWTVGGRQAREVVALIRPYVRLKRAQADALLEFKPLAIGRKGPRSEQAARYAELRAPQEVIYARLRELKRRRD